MEHRVLLFGVEHALGGGQLANLDAVQRPPVRLGDRSQFFGCLREGDIEHRLTLLGAGHEELQRQGGLAGTGHPLDQIQALAGQASAEDVIEVPVPRSKRGCRIRPSGEYMATTTRHLES